MNLLSQHLQTRKKYFEYFYRVGPKQLEKLEKNFYHSLKVLRNYEASLSSEAQTYLDQKRGELCLDTAYSDHRKGDGPFSSPKEGEDPHFLKAQRSADYSKDTEESHGTLDDYKRYREFKEG